MSRSIPFNCHTEIKLLSDKGIPQTEIAKRFGVTQTNISQLLKRIKNRKIPPQGNYKQLGDLLIYDDARVWSIRSSKLRVPVYDPNGYILLALTKDAREALKDFGVIHKSRNALLSRIILTVFKRPPREGEQARHYDGNPSHNHLKNLNWGKQSDNEKDKKRHGTFKHHSLLNYNQVYAIKKEFLKWKGTQKEFAIIKSKVFHVSKDAILNIINGRNWKHVTIKRFIFSRV